MDEPDDWYPADYTVYEEDEDIICACPCGCTSDVWRDGEQCAMCAEACPPMILSPMDFDKGEG